MAILHNGLYGGVTGKLGNTVTYMLNGKRVVRMIGKYDKPPTFKQLVNRQGMAVCNKFLKQLTPFIEVGFKVAAKGTGMYPQNKAVSYNKMYALMGEYPDIEMDYAKALVSYGDLVGLEGVSAMLVADGLRFTWDPVIWMGWPRCNDQVMLLAFLPDVAEGYQSAYFVLSGARRLSGVDFLYLPPEVLGERMELYIAVIADDRKQIANSQYLGRKN